MPKGRGSSRRRALRRPSKPDVLYSPNALASASSTRAMVCSEAMGGSGKLICAASTSAQREFERRAIWFTLVATHRSCLTIASKAASVPSGSLAGHHARGLLSSVRLRNAATGVQSASARALIAAYSATVKVSETRFARDLYPTR